MTEEITRKERVEMAAARIEDAYKGKWGRYMSSTDEAMLLLEFKLIEPDSVEAVANLLFEHDCNLAAGADASVLAKLNATI